MGGLDALAVAHAVVVGGCFPKGDVVVDVLVVKNTVCRTSNNNNDDDNKNKREPPASWVVDSAGVPPDSGIAPTW